ncbi:MAG: aminoacyl-histidine dipeptidase [Deltaproteobacteria bacterium]|nr:aminoacyl-histidine dipeptidase [Deltaproteobacteria bacterium]
MDDILDGLSPAPLWAHFGEISAIPRCSGNEERIRAYVLETAKGCGLESRMDTAGNLVVYAGASPGHEKAPSVVLQGHLDMVCEKEKDSPHDFARDPIRLKKQGDWITADGTTLGADNGIGVAAALAVLTDTKVVHGPLECLFTVDEETGLAGASGLAPDMLSGQVLINLDTEEDGALYIGCAGGCDTQLILDLETETPSTPDGRTVRLHLGGLQGGHSGIDIHRQRGNAIRLLVRFLWTQQAAGAAFRLVAINGGTKHNAIPRDCEALVWVPEEGLEPLTAEAARYAAVLSDEHAVSDPNVRLDVVDTGTTVPEAVFSTAFQERALNILYGLPNGVISMSQVVPDLVETSTNLAVVKTGADRLRILTSQRSSVPSALEDVCGTVCAVARQAGARVRRGEPYPAWKPNPDSALLKTAETVYRSLFGGEPRVKAVHAGLECGIIGARFSGMDMISFGPTIQGAHCPSERVQVSTVGRFWRLLTALIEALAS